MHCCVDTSGLTGKGLTRGLLSDELKRCKVPPTRCQTWQHRGTVQTPGAS